jgi:hypothetical protein
VIGMLNSVLWSKTILHKTKTHVPGFSPRYFSIRGRNMDTKHTTGEQITGLRWIFGEDLLENQGKKSPKCHH